RRGRAGTSTKAGPSGARRGRLELRQSSARALLATGERQPQGQEPVQLDLRVLARAFGVGEQPLDARTPVAGVEVQLAGEMLDRMPPPGGFISDTRGQLQRAEDDVLRLSDLAAVDQECAEPVPRLQRQARKDAPFRLVQAAPGPLPGLLQPPHPAQGTGTIEQRREV